MPRHPENARPKGDREVDLDSLPPGAPEDGVALAERLGLSPGVIRKCKAKWDLDEKSAELKLRAHLRERGYPMAEPPDWIEQRDQDISEFFVAIPEGGLLFVRRAFPAEPWEWIAKALKFKESKPRSSKRKVAAAEIPSYLSAEEVERLLGERIFDWRAAAERADISVRAISAHRQARPGCIDARNEILNAARSARELLPRLPRGVIAKYEFYDPVLLCDDCILRVQIDDRYEMKISNWHDLPAPVQPRPS